MKRETVSRRDWNIMVGNLDGDTQVKLRSDLESYEGGESCEFVEFTPDSKGNLDFESSPAPADCDPRELVAEYEKR